jgi:V8-like Glu-specific endopeptidase
MITNTAIDDLKYKNAIARIYNYHGAVVGAGFLVSNQHLLTCAHVATTALGLPIEEKTKPSNSIQLDFPFIDLGKKLEANVEIWHPYQFNSSEKITDIAVLKLQKPILDGTQAKLIPLINSSKSLSENQHRFKVFGFPNEYPTGIWAYVDMKDPLPNGWVQMEGITGQGQPVKPGFSGAPVWDDIEKAVVGMAVAADTDEQKKLAFLLPTQILFSAWIELSSLVNADPTCLDGKKSKMQLNLNESDKNYLITEIENKYLPKKDELKNIFLMNKTIFGNNFYSQLEDEHKNFKTRIIYLVGELIDTGKLNNFLEIVRERYPLFANKI